MISKTLSKICLTKISFRLLSYKKVTQFKVKFIKKNKLIWYKEYNIIIIQSKFNILLLVKSYIVFIDLS